MIEFKAIDKHKSLHGPFSLTRLTTDLWSTGHSLFHITLHSYIWRFFHFTGDLLSASFVAGEWADD